MGRVNSVTIDVITETITYATTAGTKTTNKSKNNIKTMLNIYVNRSAQMLWTWRDNH